MLVEGKRYSMASMSTATKLGGIMHNALTDLEHMRDSPDGLSADLGIAPDEALLLDTVMVVWHCHEGWDGEQAREWLRKAPPMRAKDPPVTLLVSHNEHLGRLASLHSFRREFEDMEFYYAYQNGYDSLWHATLSPEYLHSMVIPARYRRDERHPFRHGVFAFDLSETARIRFLLKYLHHIHYFHHDRIEILTPAPEVQIEQIQNEVNRLVREMTLSRPPTIEVSMLDLVPFNS